MDELSLGQALATTPRSSAGRIQLPAGLCCSVATDGARYLVIAEHLREARVADPANREVLVSCGVAAEHVLCALERLDHFAELVVMPSGGSDGVVAQIHAFPRREAPERRPDPLATRLSHPVLLRALRDGARREHAFVDIIVDDCRRELIADLLARHAARALPVRSMERPPPPALNPTLQATGHSLAVVDPNDPGELRSRIRDADLLFVLGVQRDEPAHWVNAGRVLYRSLLLAAGGRETDVTSAPVDDAALRDGLRPLLFAGGVPLVVVALRQLG